MSAMKKNGRPPLSTGVLALAVTLIAPVTMGQDNKAKTIAVVPDNPHATVQLQLSISQPTVKVNDQVTFDFSASADGYVSLWDVGTSGKVTRIFPNPHGGNPRVRAGVRYGAGGAHDRFAFQVKKPLGMEDVYLLWTQNPEAQPQPVSYEDANALSKDLRKAKDLPQADWAVAKVTFEITADGKPQIAQLPAPVATIDAGPGRVYILAMGANVAGLTKTNADAQNFATTLQQLFKVPNNQVRVIENVYKQSFAMGMEWLRTNTRSDDLVLIFFSGHGSTIDDEDGDEADGLDEVFVTYDAKDNQNDPSHLVRDDEFAAWIDKLPTDRVITFIDACFSEGLLKSLTNARVKFFRGGQLGQPKPGGWQQKAQRPLLKDMAGGMDGSRGLERKLKGLVYAAAQEGEYAIEQSYGGLFITHLLQMLSKARNTYLSDVFAETRDMVIKESERRQTPTAIGNTQLGKTFYLASPRS